MKNILIKAKNKVVLLLFTMAASLSYAPAVFASDKTWTVKEESVGALDRITKIAGVLLAVGTAGGVIILVYGAISFAISYSKAEQHGEHEALKKIITGLLLAGLSTIVNLLVSK